MARPPLPATRRTTFPPSCAALSCSFFFCEALSFLASVAIGLPRSGVALSIAACGDDVAARVLPDVLRRVAGRDRTAPSPEGVKSIVHPVQHSHQGSMQCSGKRESILKL